MLRLSVRQVINKLRRYEKEGDDATGRMWGKFVKSESRESVMGATKEYFKIYGRPLSFYVDFGSVFSVNVNNADRDKLTQFQRACK